MENPTGELLPQDAESIELRNLPDGRIGIAFFKSVDVRPYNHLVTVQVPAAALIKFAVQLKDEIEGKPSKYRVAK